MRTLQTLVAVALVGVFLAVFSAAVSAAQSQKTIVMSDLNNPRGLTFAPAGQRGHDSGHGRRPALFVAEAGTGGTLRCTQIRGTVCVGLTGSVSRYWRGEQQRIVENLPSYAPFFSGASAGAVGPSDVSFAGGRGYVVIGLAANPDVRDALGESLAGSPASARMET
jgi:hypothetical protein